MSARNKRSAKAARRQERAARRTAVASSGPTGDDLVRVQSYDELVGQAERGERLPCGCDAHELLHSGAWHMLADMDD